MDVVSTKYRMFPFMGITMHWIENANMKELALALIPLHGPHSGENLFDAFIQVVDKEFNILKKVKFYKD